MPGMGMDPMAMSQGMYGGFGGQGMGMNGMNMGMGFNTAGQGAFGGGFNGQPAAWNTGQDKFNQNAYGGQAGIGGGDFGANTGYGGYNMPPHQGNFNQMHQHQYPNNDFHHGHHGQGFQNRGRGRGRGYLNAGRGRGGYNQNFSQGNQFQNKTNYEPFHQQVPAQVTRRGSPIYGPQQDEPLQQQEQDQTTIGSQQGAKLEEKEENANGLTAEEQLNKELDPGDADENIEKPPDSTAKEEQVEPPVEESIAKIEAPEEIQREAVSETKEEKTESIPTFVSDETSKPELPAVDTSTSNPPTMMPPPSPMIPTGPSALHADQALDTSPRGRGAGRGFYGGSDYRGGSRGRGSVYPPHNSFPRVTPPVVKAVVPPSAPKGLGVEGAPKAPKALREGQVNTGIKGFSIVGRASVAAQSRPNDSTATRRYASMWLLRYRVHLLTVYPAHPEIDHVPLRNTSPLTTDIIATAPPVPQMTASTRGGESATVVILEGTRTRTVIPKNTKVHALGSHQPIHQLSEAHTEAVVTMRRKGTGTGAVTGPTDPTMKGLEKRTRSIEATGSAQSPQRSVSTALAEETYPTLILMPTAT